MIGGALALIASLFLGVSDFLGGVLSRRLPLVTVLLLSQGVATLLILTTLLWSDPATGLGGAALWGVIGGIATAVGVSALYAALASGTMGVVAPLTALSVLVPVSAGVLGGDQLGALLIGGIVLAILGTVMSSGPEFSRREAGHGPRPIILGLVSALGFGFANVSVAWGSAFNVTGTLVVNSLTVVTLYGLAALILRQAPRARGRELVGVVAIGILGISAQLCWAVASTTGELSVVGVLASLYPVVTVLLGWWFLKERLLRVQILGVVTVFVGVALIALSTTP